MVYLFFYNYVDEWIQKTRQKDFVAAHKFGNGLRFIEDLADIVDGIKSEKALHETSRPESKL